MTPYPDQAILRWLARRTHALAQTIGTACAMSPGEVISRLSALESLGLVGSRQDTDSVRPRRAFYITAEGRLKAGIMAARVEI